MAVSWRSHGDQDVAIRNTHFVLSRSYVVLVGDCLRSRGASIAFIVLSRRSHGAPNAFEKL